MTIESAYGLSPMQEGILVHSLYTPGTDVYFCQAHWPVYGDLDVPAFHAAWRGVVDRHTALRASFHAGGRDGPVQMVHRSAPVPLTEEDWRGLSEAQRAERLQAFLRANRERGVDLARAPLLRVAVLRQAEEEWRIVWSAHHLLVDGRAVSLVVREVLALYEARVAGEEARLPEPVPYERFIAWQAAQDRAAAEHFWRSSLRGFGTPTPFARESERDEATSALDRVTIRLAPGVERGLRALAGASETTLNTVIMGAWAILLSRYSSRDDVVFGLTVGSGGEGAPLTRALVGLVINTIPLRVQVAPEERVGPFLRSVRSRVLEARRFASTPLVDIARWSRIPPATQLFDTLVGFDNSSLDRLTGHRGTLCVGDLEIVQGSPYPLNLIVQRGRPLRLDLLYRRGGSLEPKIAHLAGQLEYLLAEMSEDADRRLDELSALSAAERRQVVVSWNNTHAAYPRDRCPYELFEAQARRRPDALAVADRGRRLTYGELNRQATRLAERLRVRGVGPETVVGLRLERSVDLVTAMLGIARVGGASLLLDPCNPPDRTASMLADSGTGLVVTEEHLRSQFPSHVDALFVGDEAEGEFYHGSSTPRVSPASLAYVVYTSGTTGMPKGVMVEGRSVVNLISWHLRAFQISPEDRATQVAGPGFDAAIWEIWPYLAAGASIHIPPEGVRGIPVRLRDWLLEEAITVSFLPTPLAEAMLSLEWPAETPLRTVLVGGDVLHAAPPPGLPFQVVNNYGPSECTVVATSGVVHAGEAGPPPIGRPIANTQVYLLDARRRPVHVGVTGELYIGGDGLARGYLNRPELTAERFVPHPSILGERVYRTGDLGRYLPNGDLEFVGRRDRQVKLRGYRIELGEIEAALRRQEYVQDAAVVVRDDGPAGRQVIAYVVPAGGSELDPAGLRRSLRARLPEYMVPAAFVRMPALPLSPNGKVDLHALPAPRAPARDAGEELVVPRTPPEEAIAALWEEILGVESVGVRDSFFDLGGDSLSSVRLIEGMRARLGVDITPSALFHAPTIEELALAIDDPRDSPADTLAPIRRAGARTPFFCAAPVLGTVFPYYELAHLLSEDQPFYGLQPAGFPAAGGTGIETLAGRYVDALRRVQPRGPYRIGGWSFGGLVAFEMAQQLRRAGQEVSLLAVIDTPAPHPRAAHQGGRALRFLASTLASGLWGYVQDYGYLALAAGPAHRTMPPAGGVLAGARRALGRRAAIAAVVDDRPHLAGSHLPSIREMSRSFAGGLVATLRYRPRRYPGEITLLATDEPMTGGQGGALLGWDELAGGGVRLYRVPGNHMTLLRPPFLSSVAAALQAALDGTARVRSPV